MNLRLCTLMVVLTGGCASAPPPPVHPGGPVDFSLPIWASSQQHSFADDRGHVVVLDAWATWCTPCRTQLPQLDALARKWAARGLRVYAVNIDQNAQGIQPFLIGLSVDLPVLLDPSGTTLAKMLNLETMPTTWVIDPGGRVVLTERSGTSLSAVETKVEQLLTGLSGS